MTCPVRAFVLLVSLLPTPALVAQTPFVDSFYLPRLPVNETCNTVFTDLFQTVKTVTVPGGVATFTWSIRVRPGGSIVAWIRPAIGPHAPSEGLFYRFDGTAPQTLSGSWSTPVDAGEIDVRLQAMVGTGCFRLSDALTWTLIVFPHSPACGNGLLEPCQPCEQCDDGNTADGYGCSATCQVEPFCGDAICQSEEGCECPEDCASDEVCNDEADNDCDGATDCDDPDCLEAAACQCIPTSQNEKGPRCSDGLDNDCDGLTDEADPDCR